MQEFKYITLIVIIILSSCSILDPSEDAGDYMEARIYMEAFSTIKIEGIFNLELIPDSVHYIFYKGGDNIYDLFEYKINESTLSINHTYSNWLHNLDIPTIEIHLKDLEQIFLKNSCNLISSKPFTGNQLYIQVLETADVIELEMDLNYQSLRFHAKGSSSGKYLLSGNCPEVNYTFNGSTNMYATDLISRKVSIGQNSVSNAHISVSDTLLVTFYNSGDIYYSGNPIIQINRVQINNQSPSGKVIPE